MPDKKETKNKKNPHLDSTIGDVSSSLIVYPSKVLKKRSLMSIIIKGRSRTKRLTSNDLLKQVLTSKEEQVFKAALARQPNEDKFRVKKKISSGMKINSG